MKNLSLEDYRAMCTPPIDTYTPTINCEVSEKMYMHWLSTVKTCLNVSEESEQVSKEEVNLLLESKSNLQNILKLRKCFIKYIFLLNHFRYNEFYFKLNTWMCISFQLVCNLRLLSVKSNVMYQCIHKYLRYLFLLTLKSIKYFNWKSFG